MRKFDHIPPQADVPRARDELPEQAMVPTLDVIPGPPDGLPMIPVEEFSDQLPDEAEDALDGILL